MPGLRGTLRPGEGHLTAGEFHPLEVSAVERLTPGAVAVSFALPPDLTPAYRFRAGQHLTLRRVVDGVDVRRTYSLCSPEGGPLRIGVARTDGGAMSPWLVEEVSTGTVIEVAPPAGRFGVHPDVRPPRRLAAVAAGSGITPVLSIVSTVLEQEPESQVWLVYGNRTTADVMFLEELADLKDRYSDRFLLLHVLSREETDSPLLSGRIDPARLHRLLDTVLPPNAIDEWVCCGPYGMVSGARATLLEHGVAADRVRSELFYVEAAPPRPRARPAGAPADGSRVTAVLAGRATTVTVPFDGPSILDSLLAVRPDAPYACKGGVCATCRARLVDGRVEMDRNFALEPDELASDVVLTCQSHPLTPTVRLEYL